jgi:hypothetical protein
VAVTTFTAFLLAARRAYPNSGYPGFVPPPRERQGIEGRGLPCRAFSVEARGRGSKPKKTTSGCFRPAMD